MFVISACALLVGLIVWLIWKNRQPSCSADSVDGSRSRPPTARVVMGMEVSPETLPADVPAAAWELWRQGRHQEALGLLYRGAISRVIEVGRVEIQESDTEGDCVRRVDQAGAAAHPDYFRASPAHGSAWPMAGGRPEDRGSGGAVPPVAVCRKGGPDETSVADVCSRRLL